MEKAKVKITHGLANPAIAKCGDEVLVATGYMGWGPAAEESLRREPGRIERESGDAFLIRYYRSGLPDGVTSWTHKNLIASVLTRSCPRKKQRPCPKAKQRRYRCCESCPGCV